MLCVKMMEKCTRSTPSGFSAGVKIGITTNSVAITSRKQPVTSSSTFIASRNCHIEKPCSTVNCTSWPGMPDSVIQWPNASALAIISMIAPALRSASAITLSVCESGNPR